MQTYTVFLYRSGRVFVVLGTVPSMPDSANTAPLLVKVVEALSEWAAVGKVLLQLYDQTQQPFQHVCAPHYAPTSTPHISLSDLCTACQNRILGVPPH